MEMRPIDVATSLENQEMVKFLIEQGADVNAPSHRGAYDLEYHSEGSPGIRDLHPAAINGHLGIVRVLLQAGADPNVVNANNSSRTPLMLACAGLGEVLMGSPSVNGEGLDKVVNGQRLYTETGRGLLKAGADPLMTDKGGCLALHFAATMGKADVVSMLLSAATDTINQVNAHKETALFLAAAEGHATSVDRLLSAGGNQEPQFSANNAKGTPVVPTTTA